MVRNTSGKTIRVGVDIGGTFTDLVAQRADDTLHILKVASSPDDPGDAVVHGLRQLLDEVGAKMADVAEIVHGTTVGSNTILQRNGALTGLITTRGFRDVLEIGRIRTPVMFDLTWRKPQPLAERRHRVEVSERIGADGVIVTPLDESDVRRAGSQLADAGVQAVAVCLLNSYLNSEHEARVADILRREFPQLLVSASYEVLPEIKEYERTSTTVVNAYLLESMRRYLSRLGERLADAGLRAPIRVVTSQGTMMTAAVAADKPAFVVGSGPAAGVIGAARLAPLHGASNGNAIAFDLGGTTAKASLIEGGEVTMTAEYEFRDGISTPSRFVKGGGYMLKVPAIDIAEVGAGGGSLAWIDAGGLLRIGPQSAGAEPGPACYGRGNGQPTVTDANVVLGYLNPTTLAGGSLNIQPELSAQAIARNIASPLGLSTVAAASGIRHIANLEMARAIRTVSVERGHDTRLMSLIACGGGGPVHAVDVAAMLDIPRVVITPMSGVFCSLGMLGAPTGRAFVRSLARPLQGMTATQLEPTKQALLETAQAAMQSEGLTLSDLRMQWSVDARFFGQSSELSIPIEPGAGSEQIGQRFAAAYQKQYDTVSDEPIELVNLRLSVFGDEQELLDFGAMGANERQLQRIDTSAHRAVWFDTPRLQADAPGSPSQTAQNGFIDVPVFERPSLPTGKQIAGPAIIEAYDTTIVIPPGYDAAVASSGSVTIDRIRQADPS